MIPESTVTPYVISPGDQLAIKFYLTPGIERGKCRFSLTDSLNLRLVGSIRAEGKTPERLVRYLELAYSKRAGQPGHLGRRAEHP